MPEEKSEVRDFHFRPALLCWSSARLPGLIVYAAVETQQGHLLSVTGSLLLKSSSRWNPGSVAQLQQKVLTFKSSRSHVAALWLGLINWCHRKRIASLSTACPSFLRSHHRLEIEFWHWHNRTHLHPPCSHTCACIHIECPCRSPTSSNAWDSNFETFRRPNRFEQHTITPSIN